MQSKKTLLFGNKGLLRHKGKNIPLDLQKGEEFIFKI